jgi:arylsulfatase A-like enzyme
MTSQNKKSYYLLTPVLLALMGLAIYMIFQLPEEEDRQPNVLFITMDSLRYDHLGCAGYERAHTPNIDALAREGTVFMEAMAQATFTHISLPSMITGKHPAFTGVKSPADDLDSSHTTLAEVMQEQGYLTSGIVGGWKESLYQGFERLEPSGHSTVWKTLLCLKVLDQLDDRPFFIWLYYWDPHASYRPPEKYMKLYEPDYVETSPRAYLDEKNWEKKKAVGAHRDYSGHYNGDIATLVKLNLGEIKPTAMDRAHLINLYDAEIAYVDDEIGKVVAKLKKMKLYDNTLIVLQDSANYQATPFKEKEHLGARSGAQHRHHAHHSRLLPSQDAERL